MDIPNVNTHLTSEVLSIGLESTEAVQLRVLEVLRGEDEVGIPYDLFKTLGGELGEGVVALEGLDAINEGVLDDLLPLVLVEELEVVADDTVGEEDGLHVVVQVSPFLCLFVQLSIYVGACF